MRPFVAPKGSIAVDGVSLTVNRTEGLELEVMVIPATLRATTLSDLALGAEANLEADLIARYAVGFLMGKGRGGAGEAPGLTLEKRMSLGY